MNYDKFTMKEIEEEYLSGVFITVFNGIGTIGDIENVPKGMMDDLKRKFKVQRSINIEQQKFEFHEKNSTYEENGSKVKCDRCGKNAHKGYGGDFSSTPMYDMPGLRIYFKHLCKSCFDKCADEKSDYIDSQVHYHRIYHRVKSYSIPNFAENLVKNSSAEFIYP